MEHTPEFSDAAAQAEAERKRKADARDTANAYARLFSSEDGKAVLEDLRRKFGHDRPRFDIRFDKHNSLTAALIDGQCYVLREIEKGIRTGGGKA